MNQSVLSSDISDAEIVPVATTIFKDSIYQPSNALTADDITMVLCVRSHELNPWVTERIRLISTYYDPMPKVLVVDFGSEPTFAAELSTTCAQSGFTYEYIDDQGVYSPAAAHNRGFEKCQTELVFFCDVDCFGSSDMFARLGSIATSLRMREVIDTPMVLPVYHMNEADTQNFFEQPNTVDKSLYLDAFTYYSGITNFRKAENFFIAPYSNIFLISRKMFSLSGGYDERFRGHGSEDFEYLTRLALYIKNLPIPVNVTSDWLGPLTKNFNKARPYSGFRRLLESLSKPAENYGLRVHHLYHPKPRNAEWEAGNDWKRDRMREAFDAYIGKENNLLNADYIQREKTIACLCKHVDQWGYFTPLRLAGFRLDAVFDDLPPTIEALTAKLASGEIAGIAIFNPYMKSHANFKQLLLLAQSLGKEVIIIERGALPNTIYYDADVAYNSPNFTQEAFEKEEFTESEMDRASRYITDLRTGDKTLESMDSYSETATRYSALRLISKTICFIPLQLEDDMAVTMFVKGEQSYSEFASSLDATIDANPDVIFIVKPHPLSKLDLLGQKPNLFIANRSDNIHFLLDLASFVVCYNSGVGLLSIAHDRPTATIGNAFYNICRAGASVSSLQDAINRFQSGMLPPPHGNISQRLIAWFTLRRYSSFTAVDKISEFASRKAHGYTDILVTHFRWNGTDVTIKRQKQIAPFGKHSYQWAQIADALGLNPTKPKPEAPTPKKLSVVRRKVIVPLVLPFVALIGTKKDDVTKFNADPCGYFAKLKNPLYRLVGKVLFGTPK